MALFFSIVSVISTLIMLVSVLILLIYFVGWKLKNRKHVLKLSLISTVVAFVVTSFVLWSIPIFYRTMLKNEKVFKYLQEYYSDNGSYPPDINNFETKYDSYYKTFNDDKDFVLFFGVNRVVWAYCTKTEENKNCIPDKWLFLKDGQHQWIDIPEHYKENVNLFQKRGNFNVYYLEI